MRCIIGLVTDIERHTPEAVQSLAELREPMQHISLWLVEALGVRSEILQHRQQPAYQTWGDIAEALAAVQAAESLQGASTDALGLELVADTYNFLSRFDAQYTQTEATSGTLDEAGLAYNTSLIFSCISIRNAQAEAVGWYKHRTGQAIYDAEQEARVLAACRGRAEEISVDTDMAVEFMSRLITEARTIQYQQHSD